MLSNSDSIINYKFRSFRIRVNFFIQSGKISINRFFTNRFITSIIALIYLFIKITRTRFSVISCQLFYRF